jgi:thioredoxin 1
MKKNVVVILITLLLLVVAIFVFAPKTGKQVVQDPQTNTTTMPSPGKTNVLSQGASIYKEFSQSEYEKALQSGKIVYLEFYANWCPICRAQEPDLIEGFKQLQRDDVVGFRVNYKDDQTDESEKALAEKYKISYQHHKIVLKNNQVVINSPDSWDSQTLVEELSKL